jgi:hypothetical protein
MVNLAQKYGKYIPVVGPAISVVADVAGAAGLGGQPEPEQAKAAIAQAMEVPVEDVEEPED